MSICDYCYESTDVKPFRGEEICRECRVEILMKEDSVEEESFFNFETEDLDSYVMSDKEIISEYSPVGDIYYE
jgi:hypothetical protein